MLAAMQARALQQLWLGGGGLRNDAFAHLKSARAANAAEGGSRLELKLTA